MREERFYYDEVMCDFCDREFNELPHTREVGGITFGSKAACPSCVERIETGARKHGEEHLIRYRAEPGETFVDFVHRLRGHDEGVTIIRTLEPGDDIMDLFKK